MISYQLARHAGFCVGVDRALRTVGTLLDEAEAGGKQVRMWGPVIHNRAVLAELEARGARVAGGFDELTPDCVVVFRAHGVAPCVPERLSALGIAYEDATCAHVRVSQRLAREKADAGCQVVLIGDAGHPEITGINAWAYGWAIVAGDFAELTQRLDTARRDRGGAEDGPRRLCVLAQTTYNAEAFRQIAEALRERYPDCEVYDTVCGATGERQAAAAELAERSDVMLVIGSPESANAKKLFSLCAERCGEAHMVETVGDLPPPDIFFGKRVGVTAGASTPDRIIEEVIAKMEEIKRLDEELEETTVPAADMEETKKPDADLEESKKSDGDINFAEEMESSLVYLQVGQTVKGRIIRYNNTEVYIDLGYKSDGVIPIDEFISDTDQDPTNNIKIDDVIDVYVVRVNDSEGTVQLSKKRVDEKNNWARIEEAFDNNTNINAVVTDVTNGGLIVTSGGVRIFVPASQVSDRYVEDLRGYLRKPVELRMIDYNKQKRKFVGSMKAIIIEEKRRAAEALWNEIEVGMEYEGTVKSLTAFGAFVDIGGVDGLVHISELSWSRIKHPSDVVKVGEQVNVRVVSLDREKKKISLGYRREEDNPWYRIEEKYPVGSIVTKRVVRIAPFGAFVELERGIDALVHVSQISDTRIARPDDVLRVGMEVTARITELNLETKKISMSIKEVEPIPYYPPLSEGEDDAGGYDEPMPPQPAVEVSTALGDMLRSVASELLVEEPAAETAAEPVESEAAAPAETAEPKADKEEE